MSYVYSKENIKQFSLGKKLGVAIVTTAVTQVAWMLVNQLTDSINKGDFERAFVKFKNDNVFKRMMQNAKEKKQLKIEQKVDTSNIKPGLRIKNALTDTEFLVLDVTPIEEGKVKVKYSVSNPEEIGIDASEIAGPAEIEMTDKDLSTYTKVL